MGDEALRVLANNNLSRFRTCFHGDLDKVGEIRGLRRYWGRPVKHPANPLFPTEPDDVHFVADSFVYHDDTENIWKLWYTTSVNEPVGKCVNPLAYAVSKDGITWERPALGIIPRESPDERNFVYSSEGKSVSGGGVLFEPEEPDHSRRCKLFYCTQMWTPETGVKHDSDCRVAFSSDGIHWTPYEGNPVLHIMSDTRHSVFKDPYTGKYVCPMRLRINPDGRLLYRHGDPITGESVRCCGRIESEDFIHWSEPELIIAPSEWTTQGDSYYALTILPYEGQYLGLLRVFHRYAPNYGYLEEQLVISQDGHAWRPAGDSMFLTPGEPGEWDSGVIDAAPRVFVHGDRIMIYYGGSPRSHGGGTPVPVPLPRLGLATLRLDGFAYLEPPWQEGILTTHPFNSLGGELHINADAGDGAISVAVLDSSGKPLPGYTHEDCADSTSDSIDAAIVWKKHKTIPSGQALRLEFRLRQAKLYSFRLPAAV